MFVHRKIFEGRKENLSMQDGMKLTRAIFLILAIIYASISTASSWEKKSVEAPGKKVDKLTERQKNEASYLENLQKEVKAGSPAAQLTYGAFLLDGRYVEKNFSEGMRLITRAADSGYIKANTFLGTLYQKGGDEFPKNPSKAEYYLTRAAEKNDAEAEYRLWVLYAFDPQKSNQKKAKEMLERSVAQGHIAAMSDLGQSIFYGRNGFHKNQKRGTDLISAAAKDGDSRAMYILAFLYVGGKDSPFSRDIVMALAWVKLSQEFSTTSEIKNQGYVLQQALERSLSPNEMKESDAMTDKLKAQFPSKKD